MRGWGVPIRIVEDASKGLLFTILEGDVDDEQLIAHYRTILDQGLHLRYRREVIDGREVDKILVTPQGTARLGALLAPHRKALSGYKAAMLATRDLVYGLFRQWELSRGALGYDLKVFRDEAQALLWLEEE